MLTVEGALERILSDVPLQPVEEVPLEAAHGRLLAHDLHAPVDLPPWDNSAMDGYAVRAADTADGEVELRLVEMIGAGRPGRLPVLPGTASGITTGAPMPEGADAVVMVEYSDGSSEGTVRLRGKARPGQHVRPRGDDVTRGERLLPAGHPLDAGALGLVASLGMATVPVRRRPVVAVLSTGDEVVPPGQPLGPGQIWSSNNSALVGLLHEAGAHAVDHGNAPDDPRILRTMLEACLEADAVLTTGGVSVGAYDHVKDVYAELGIAVDFWRVRMKPGKPLAFGRARVGERRVPVFGLPGNPVSCMVNFLQFVRPWLRTSMGDPQPWLPVIQARLAHDLRDKPGRARLVRVRLEHGPDGIVAHSAGNQSSGALSTMARAHGFLLLGPDAPSPRAGQTVRVQLFSTRFLDGTEPGYGW